MRYRKKLNRADMLFLVLFVVFAFIYHWETYLWYRVMIISLISLIILIKFYRFLTRKKRKIKKEEEKEIKTYNKMKYEEYVYNKYSQLEKED